MASASSIVIVGLQSMRLTWLAAALLLLQRCPGASADVVQCLGQPKAGTTWLEVIVDALVTAAGGTVDKAARVARYGDERIESVGQKNKGAMASKHGLPGFKLGNFGVAFAQSYNRVCRACVARGNKVWSPACVNASLLAAPDADARFVLILRDPRAVAVSWARYTNKRVDAHYFLDGVPQIAAVESVRYAWHAGLLRKTNPSLVLFYEDLVGSNSIDAYYELATFLRVALSPTAMRRVVEDTSADSMRDAEARGALPGPNRAGRPQAKVRAATADSFRGDVAPDVLANATRAMAAVLHPALAVKWLRNDADASFLAGLPAR